MKKNYHRSLILIGLFILFILYIFHSNLVIKEILEYTNLFFKKLFPVSFLFFVFSSLLVDYGLIEMISKIFHCNGSIFYVGFMSMISGFPSGAKYTKDMLLKNFISIDVANYLILFTHFPNPLFVLGSVNLILKNSSLCWKMLGSFILSNLILAFLFKKKEKKKYVSPPFEKKSFASSLQQAILSSIKVLIVIYGSSVFFYLIAALLNHYLVLSPLCYTLINGFFDLTKGVFSTTLLSNSLLQSYLILIFISMGGLSIHMQVNSIIADTEIQYKKFVLGRVLGTFLALIIFSLFFLF